MAGEREGEFGVEIGELDTTPSEGRIEVIEGSMFSGKSKELIRRVNVLKRSIEARIKSGLEKAGTKFEDLVVVFKPAIDKRRGDSTINSKDGDEFPAISIDSIDEVLPYLTEHPMSKTVAIDEAQFFNGDQLVKICKFMADQMGIRVIVAGLTKDFKGANWGGVGELGLIANETTHLVAACAICGEDATMTQRLKLDPQKGLLIPVSIDDPVELVGESQYQARCRKHHQLV